MNDRTRADASRPFTEASNATQDDTDRAFTCPECGSQYVSATMSDEALSRENHEQKIREEYSVAQGNLRALVGEQRRQIEGLCSDIEKLEDTVAKVPPIFLEAAALCESKSEDYGTKGDLSKARLHPFGHTSYLQMLHTKLERLKSVAKQKDTNYESARDSVIDLINYAGFYGAWMDEQQVANECLGISGPGCPTCNPEPEPPARPQPPPPKDTREGKPPPPRGSSGVETDGEEGI